jgi:pyruvate/2-oxoglutarate dehydrogenase complex dihydrolipoamide acyltransferase (E2) component
MTDRQTETEWTRLRPSAATMAKVMQASAAIPVAAEWLDVDVVRALEFVATLKPKHPELTLTTVFLWATLHSAWESEPLWFEYQMEGFMRRRRGRLGIAVAVSTDRGLAVPTGWFEQRLGVLAVASRMREVVERTRSGALNADEREPGGLAISSIGALGIEGGIPLPRAGEVAIFGFSSVKDAAVVRNAQVVASRIVTLTGSIDHRWIDGLTLARTLVAIKNCLESLKHADAALSTPSV